MFLHLPSICLTYLTIYLWDYLFLVFNICVFHIFWILISCHLNSCTEFLPFYRLSFCSFMIIFLIACVSICEFLLLLPQLLEFGSECCWLLAYAWCCFSSRFKYSWSLINLSWFFVCDVSFFNMRKFSQHHLMDRLFFIFNIFLVPLLKIRWL